MPLAGMGSSETAVQEFFREELERSSTELSINDQDLEGMRQYQNTNRLAGLLLVDLPAQPNENELEEYWKQRQLQNKLLLTYVIVLYLLYSDDQKIDLLERHFIRNLIYRSELILTATQIREILYASKHEIGISDVLNFVRRNKYPKPIVESVVTEVDMIFRKKKKYHEPLHFLKGHLNSIE